MTVDDNRTRTGRARSQIITKIIVSLLFGAVAFLMSQALDSGVADEVILGIGVSVFVSGLAFVTQFLVDVDKRLDGLVREISELSVKTADHSNGTETLIKGEFTKINAATELFGAVERSALKTDAMTQLVKNSTTVEHTRPSLIFDFAQAEIARLSAYLRDLGQSADVTYEGEDRDWLLGLTRVASTTIDATSLTTVDAGGIGFVDGGLWASDLGRRYLEAQKLAIARGVAIRRIFILDRRELQNHQDLIEVLNEHMKIGVQVRILDPRRVPSLRRTNLVDFIVMDGVLVYRSTVTTRVEEDSHPIIENTRLVTNPDKVKDLVGRYNELWAEAQEYPPHVPRQATDERVFDAGPPTR